MCFLQNYNNFLQLFLVLSEDNFTALCSRWLWKCSTKMQTRKNCAVVRMYREMVATKAIVVHCKCHFLQFSSLLPNNQGSLNKHHKKWNAQSWSSKCRVGSYLVICTYVNYDATSNKNSMEGSFINTALVRGSYRLWFLVWKTSCKLHFCVISVIYIVYPIYFQKQITFKNAKTNNYL